jgi:putative tryptophan/tyrosine transport system substrate-binding protein
MVATGVIQRVQPAVAGRAMKRTCLPLLRRREYIAGLGGAAAWPLAAGAQQSVTPLVVYVGASSPETSSRWLVAFRAGLGENGYAERQNVTIEYRFMEGRYEPLPGLMIDIIRRPVAVIVAPSNTIALASKSATSTIPIVFGVGDDPVRLGLVASLARPGGNLTGVNFFFQEVVAKRLELLYRMVPAAVRVSVLLNPANATSAEATLQQAQEAARSIGLLISVLKASTSREIDAAFASLERDRPSALLVAGDAFFATRRVQIANLASRDRIPAAYADFETVAAGGLMSYGPDLTDAFRQMGVYTDQLLKGAKPADLPVVQSTKFAFVINMQTARTLALTVPETLLATADEVIQ